MIWLSSIFVKSLLTRAGEKPTVWLSPYRRSVKSRPFRATSAPFSSTTPETVQLFEEEDTKIYCNTIKKLVCQNPNIHDSATVCWSSGSSEVALQDCMLPKGSWYLYTTQQGSSTPTGISQECGIGTNAGTPRPPCQSQRLTPKLDVLCTAFPAEITELEPLKVGLPQPLGGPRGREGWFGMIRVGARCDTGFRRVGWHVCRE